MILYVYDTLYNIIQNIIIIIFCYNTAKQRKSMQHINPKEDEWCVRDSYIWCMLSKVNYNRLRINDSRAEMKFKWKPFSPARKRCTDDLFRQCVYRARYSARKLIFFFDSSFWRNIIYIFKIVIWKMKNNLVIILQYYILFLS